MKAVTRRPWLVVAVLLLISISATTFVKAGRAYRYDDTLALTLDSDVVPCEAPAIVPAQPRATTTFETPPLVERVTASVTIISLAPKTSPPH
jgi:hypothetical protein